MKKPLLLGEIPLKKKPFDFKKIFKDWENPSFLNQILQERSERVHRTLLEWIEKEPEPCFLLPDVLHFIELVDRKKIIPSFSFGHFEFWLNQLSHLTFEENYRIRGKIAGKSIERSDYQVLFPIGMGKIYPGTHFVTAHKSPDLDTTIASFWGWLDAFAARVSEGLHVWNLPGGPPSSQMEIDLLFRDSFGNAVFTHLAKSSSALHLTSLDLMTQNHLLKKNLDDSIGAIDHEQDKNAIIVVDKEGAYLGDWNSFDVEGVRQVIILLSSCLRWFENHLHLQLVSFFARPHPTFKQISPLLDGLFGLSLEQCEPAQEFTAKQKKQVDTFLQKVIRVSQGLRSTFQELGDFLNRFTEIPFHKAGDLLKGLKPLFDKKGDLHEDRPSIFAFLEKMIKGLHDSIFQIRSRLESLDIALQTKTQVFGNLPLFASASSEIEEIQSKIGNHPSLTVVYSDQEKHYPMGAILASDVRKPILGTVSLRDFCNRDEMTIPSYLDVISVIDHHKSQLNTFAPPLAIIADVQSSNSLVAKAAFEINDRLKKRKKSPFFIHPEREFLEYLHFLYGILDDTDLLSKVSDIDLECVVSLLNRLKSLSMKKETEFISLDDLPRDRSYLKKAARRLLQTEEMYSLYSKVYAYREKEVEQNISLCAEGKSSSFFADTKEQNGCCRIGQTKVFAKNISHFQQSAHALRTIWLDKAKKVHEQNKEIDLHLHMISTIVSADEVYRGVEETRKHKDEMWLWVTPEENGKEQLKRFLSAFQSSPGLKDNPLELELLGSNQSELGKIFQENFLDIPRKISKQGLDIAILRFKAGSLNSRKAMVSPFLPSVQ